MTTEAHADVHQFRAEIKQLLNILIHSLYKDQEIFLRELISNASDALTRLHFEMLTNSNVLDPQAELAIRLEIPEVGEGEPKKIIIRDSGIGMTKDELRQNLGTIAQSGARAFLEKVEEGSEELADIIGQFGVGFYSVFMVADEVRVLSRSYKPRAKAGVWLSQGGDSFTIDDGDKEDRGTEIHITLKSDASEFAQDWRLRDVIRRHSDYINFPIYIGDDQVNQQVSLWRKSPASIEEEEYQKFYQQMTLDFEKPLATIHFNSDAPVHVRSLLFIPAKRDRGILAARKEPGVKLYSNNVLIQEYCTDLFPKWLEFVDGVVDSEDLPLNVSRETVQNNRLMRHLGKTLRKRVLRQLNEMAEKEPETFAKFWEAHSRTFKEGLATDPAAKEEMLPYLRFHSSKSDGKLASLADYVGRMAENQEDIYYVLGDDLASVAQSPHLDPFKARDLEVFYWIDPLDAFVAPLLTEFEGKSLKNIDDAGLELPPLPDAAEKDDDADETTIEEPAFNGLVGRCVTTLGDRVTEVRASKVLKDSPVRLVSPEDTPNREMQRIQRFMEGPYEVPKKILELNRQHPLIASLAAWVSDTPDAPIIDLAIEQLYESALVQEGLHPNPAAMLPRIQEILSLAARRD